MRDNVVRRLSVVEAKMAERVIGHIAVVTEIYREGDGRFLGAVGDLGPLYRTTPFLCGSPACRVRLDETVVVVDVWLNPHEDEEPIYSSPFVELVNGLAVQWEKRTKHSGGFVYWLVYFDGEMSQQEAIDWMTRHQRVSRTLRDA